MHICIHVYIGTCLVMLHLINNFLGMAAQVNSLVIITLYFLTSAGAQRGKDGPWYAGVASLLQNVSGRNNTFYLNLNSPCQVASGSRLGIMVAKNCRYEFGSCQIGL